MVTPSPIDQVVRVTNGRARVGARTSGSGTVSNGSQRSHAPAPRCSVQCQSPLSIPASDKEMARARWTRIRSIAMNMLRIALANLRFPRDAGRVDRAGRTGDRTRRQRTAPADRLLSGMLRSRLSGAREIGAAARPRVPGTGLVGDRRCSRASASVAVVLGTERLVDDVLFATALVINRDGTIAGFQDKVQLDPSEETTYSPGSGRRVFQTGPLIFGVAICHEGWRYPETVRWAGPTRRAHRVSSSFS